MSRIPIDLPPDRYPQTNRRSRRNRSNALLFLFSFAAVFAIVMILLEIF